MNERHLSRVRYRRRSRENREKDALDPWIQLPHSLLLSPPFSFSSLTSLSAQRVPARSLLKRHAGQRQGRTWSRTPQVERVVPKRFSFLRARARARASGVTSGGTRISTRDEPLTWSNLKSYQSHLCQFSCLAW